MIIGIVGAGIAGLTAGRILSQKGHEVVILEKSIGFGGRLSTRYSGDKGQIKADHGLSGLTPTSEDFTAFVSELEGKGILAPWTDSFAFHNEEGFFEQHPSRERIQTYMAPNGMNSIGKYLSRWSDVRTNRLVGGITMVAPGARRKRPWIINMSDMNVLEADALILAVPGIQATGLLQTAQDETPIRSLFAQTVPVKYEHGYSAILTFDGVANPDWNGIACDNPVLEFISNENSKRENPKLTLVAHAHATYSHANRDTDPAIVKRAITEQVQKICGEWAGKPDDVQLHFWKYKRAQNFINSPYLEAQNTHAPLALIGDYLGGNSAESAYVSGKRLANYWLHKF